MLELTWVQIFHHVACIYQPMDTSAYCISYLYSLCNHLWLSLSPLELYFSWLGLNCWSIFWPETVWSHQLGYSSESLKPWNMLHCFPRGVGRYLECKWKGWGLNWCPKGMLVPLVGDYSDMLQWHPVEFFFKLEDVRKIWKIKLEEHLTDISRALWLTFRRQRNQKIAETLNVLYWLNSGQKWGK